MLSTMLLLLLPATASCTLLLSQNHFPQSNPHILTFLQPILLCKIIY
jgi:hypothetical protein